MPLPNNTPHAWPTTHTHTRAHTHNMHMQVTRNSSTIVVELVQRFEVENAQQVPVVIYNYYNADEYMVKYYLPETTPTLHPHPSATSITPTPYPTNGLPGFLE